MTFPDCTKTVFGSKRISASKIAYVVFHLLLILFLPRTAIAEETAIFSVLDNQNSEVFDDLGALKLSFDQLIDPSIDIESSVLRLDAMAKNVRQMAGQNASPIQKLATIRRYIYESGPWNNYQPFEYDLEDPYGESTRNKLLPVYLNKKLGNCVTMPFLFMILAEKLSVPVSASTAPVHIFVKYTDPDTGEIWNLETTSGALPARDEWYRQNLPMTDLAIENGVYMQPLTRQETIAVMAAVVGDYYAEVGRYEEAIAIYDEVLKAYPKFVYAMVKRGTAFYHLLNNNFYSKYPPKAEVTGSNPVGCAILS